MSYRSHSGSRSLACVLSAALAAAAFLSAAFFFAPSPIEARLPGPEGLRHPPRHHGYRLSKGVFLVATGAIRDHIFSKSVVLLLEYGPGGAAGVIINRPTAMKLSEEMSDVKGFNGRTDTLYFGGPVDKRKITAMLVRASGGAPPESALVFDDIYSALSRDALRRIADGGGGAAKEYRVFAGYAGWAAGQLDGEVARGSWNVVKASSSEVFSVEPDKVWQRLSQGS